MRSQATTAGDVFECDAAEHNINDGSITHGNQLSRKTTEKEEDEGAHPDDQKIWMVCTGADTDAKLTKRLKTITPSKRSRVPMHSKGLIRRPTIGPESQGEQCHVQVSYNREPSAVPEHDRRRIRRGPALTLTAWLHQRLSNSLVSISR